MASGKWSSSERRQRLPPDWFKRRARVLRRDQGICHVCHRPGADSVDHVRPGDQHDEANLAAIHKVPCHAEKSAREGGTASGKQSRARASSRLRPAEAHPGMLPTASGKPPPDAA
jgi:5-methylcytosine-specific restriction enzyme A